MNDFWSEYIQGAETLYRSRALRFCDHFAEKYKTAFDIEGRKRIIEIGCGPGALAGSLSRWYKGAVITGIDRDSGFIAYAKKHVPDVGFIVGDASELPFEDESADVTVSNTVVEHVEPGSFYKEQYRILKKGGICLVLSVRKSISVKADCISNETDFEKNIWEKTAQAHADIFTKYMIGAYAQNEAEIPMNMLKYGFKDISVDYVVADLTPDDPKYDDITAKAMIDSERYNDLESADALPKIAPELVGSADIARLKRIINEKYDRRTALYDAGYAQWDTTTTIIMAVRGVKR